MVNNDIFENTGKLVSLSFISSLMIGLGLFFYAIFNDYIYYNLNLVVTTLESNGLLGAWVGREGYLSALAFLTYGIMLVLFILSIFVTLSTWFQTEFIARVMPTLIYSTPLFSLYLNNVGLVNTAIIVIAIVLNFVDLELARFKFRKEPEQEAQELS